MRREKSQERSLQHMHGNKETQHPAIKHIHTEASIYVWLICYSVDIFEVATMCEHACSSQQSLTVIRDQTLARSKQQMNFTASRLDQFNRPSVCDALGGLAVDLHYLISNL